jgi:prepilin-type N-terminal cleavage/methylation domain-containing protein
MRTNLLTTKNTKVTKPERIMKAEMRKNAAGGGVRCAQAGFTIIELLTVMIIIVLLTGLTVGVAKHAQTVAAISRTRSEIAAMEMALERYKSDNGRYPASSGTRVTSSSGYPGTFEYSNSAVLYMALAGGSKIYYNFRADQLRTNTTISAIYIVDPFGSPYNYYQTNNTGPPSAANPNGVNNLATFDLWSYGPNGVNDEGTNDDITNWRQN